MKLSIKIILTALSLYLTGCKNDIPAFHSMLTNSDFEDFVYTDNHYLLLYSNYCKNVNRFKLYLKYDAKNANLQPIFPLSIRDTLFASNLIYAKVGKEGESWLLFDKTTDKKSTVKRYKLIKYDILRRVTEKTYFIIPIPGRDFSSIADLQIDEKQETAFYIDSQRNDIAVINLKDGRFKNFDYPHKAENGILSMFSGEKKAFVNGKFSIALNTKNATLYIINQTEGLLYSVNEKYVTDMQFYNRDIQSQIVLRESGLKGVVDVEFDRKSRPIIATQDAIYLVRNKDKTPIVKNFKYGKINAISYSNDKIYFSALSKKTGLYSVNLTK